MRAFAILFVSSLLVFASDIAYTAPPICDDPAAEPFELAGIYSSEVISNVGFDSNFVFVAGVSVLQRRYLNGSQAIQRAAPYGIASAAINLVDRRVYVSAIESAKVYVYDYDLNEIAVLFDEFDEDPSPAPGGMVGQSAPVAVHPETGDLYVASAGFYMDEGNPPTPHWVSRIQRFNASGGYDNFFINNQLGLSPNDPGFDQPNPPPPACGAWHLIERMWVDAAGNVYIQDRVNSARDRVVIHKFASAGGCETWDVTGQRTGIDRDGYVYRGVGNELSKFNPSRSELLYSRQIPAALPIREIITPPHTTDFLLVSALTGDEEEPLVTRFLAPCLEPLRIIGDEDWQDTEDPYRLLTTNVELLTKCDENKLVMEGVVADGVSPLLLRWKVPASGVIRWELQDPLYPGLKMLLGSLTSLGGSTDTLTIQSGVKEVDGEYFAFVVYSAPKNFDRAGVNDSQSTERTVRVTGRYYPTGISSASLNILQDIRVVRPPVLFVHGLWSNSVEWRQFQSALNDAHVPATYAVNYSPNSGQGFSRHREIGTVARGVRGLKEELSKVSDGTVCAQVDVVVHSLGGLLVRDYAEAESYESQDNYGYGAFHKVLFLNTPHLGSTEATAAANLRNLIASTTDPESAQMAKKISSFVGFDANSVAFRTFVEQLASRAIDDLQPGSSALSALGEFTIPSHAHVGDAWRFWSPITPPFERAAAIKSEKSAAFAWTASAFLNRDLSPDPSDLIVPVESQRGGLASGYYRTVDALFESIHTRATSSAYAFDLSLEWLRHRPDDLTFFAPSVPSPGSVGLQLSSTGTQDVAASLPSFVGRALTLTIVDPPGGSLITFPGKVIRVRVQGPLTASNPATVYFPGGAAGQQYSDLSGPNGIQITIPLEYVGPFELFAVAKRDNERLVISDHVTLTVDLAAKNPPITVQDIRVEPSAVTLSGRGATEHLTVTAECSDGIDRDVTGVGGGTTYAGASGFCVLTSDGVVAGRAPGSGSIAVANAGHSVNIPLTVLNGPEINNSPHASAGGSYAACDGQIVFLDGSASYDLDENLGDALTYLWDLDADGQFDDATGQTPSVTLAFPGAHWLLGLKVTDSHGLESIDYALLEAGPGCLDGQFVCTRTRGEAIAAFVGIDGTGNIYVAEETETSTRIVKLSSSCDSIATFPISNELNDIVVTSNGTTYIPDSFPKGIWKYTAAGVESFVSLPYFLQDIAVDAGGHIYGSDNATAGLVRKFNANGSANNTWDVSQATGSTFGVSHVAVGPQEEIYAASNDRIARGVLQGGNYVLDWVIGWAGVDAGSFDQIQGLAVGPNGDVFVSDTNNNRVQRFTSDGTFVRLWTGSGKPTNGAFDGPQSIAVGSLGQVIVVEGQFSLNPTRVQVFGTNQTVVDAELTVVTVVDQNEFPNSSVPASGCPQGDNHHVKISVAIDPNTITGPIPASAFSVSLPPGNPAILYVPVTADADATLSNGKYRTTLTLRKFGGCFEQDLIVKLNGVGIGGVPIKLRSPDLKFGTGTYGIVNLIDFASFGGDYPSPPKAYSMCADYSAPYGSVTLPDFSHFGTHNTHHLGGALLSEPAVQTASGTLRLELEEENPVIGERRLWARLVLDGVEPFRAMIIVLRSERPDFEYVGWHPSTTFDNAAGCAEVVNNGVKQVFLGVMGVGGSQGSSVELGRIEFALNSDDELVLDDDDLAFLQAELLSTDDKVLAFGGLRLERTIKGPSYQFELAQNYPNPFNPSTTISFSVARSSDVTLSIFDVRGSLVSTLVRGRREPGVHRIGWDGTDNRGTRVASGVYFYRLDAGSFRATRKMVLLK